MFQCFNGILKIESDDVNIARMCTSHIRANDIDVMRGCIRVEIEVSLDFKPQTLDIETGEDDVITGIVSIKWM